jgi:hypothetical protein
VYGEKQSYGFSLTSKELAPSAKAFARYPWTEGHWAVSAARPARSMFKAVEYANRCSSKLKSCSDRAHFTKSGIRATVLTHTRPETPPASGHHTIVYWRIGKTGYLVSVHAQYAGRFEERFTPIAEEIARGMINQIGNCPDRATGPDHLQIRIRCPAGVA